MHGSRSTLAAVLFGAALVAASAEMPAQKRTLEIAPAGDPARAETAYWESIKDSAKSADFEEYLRRYPEGRFADLARQRIKALAPAQVASIAPLVPAPAPAAVLLVASVRSLAPGTAFRDCDACPEMVVIPAGSFMMGSPSAEPGRDSDEGPQYPVTIARQFAAGRYETTFDEWDACARDGGCRRNPSDSGWGRGRQPAIDVSWNDAQQFVGWLSRKTGKRYRLLTEAEWEYAARAGTTTPFSTGATIAPTQANYDARQAYAGGVTGVFRRQAVPVGSFPPNAFKLYDLHGNVWEWIEDCWNASYEGAPADGSAWTAGDCGRRVLRSGSWSYEPGGLRSANRAPLRASDRNSYLGFRVARSD